MADRAAETMRDRGRFWSAVPDWTSAQIERDGWSVRRIHGLGQTLVSGDVQMALDRLVPGGAQVGLWGLTDTDRMVIRIARDRGLLVTPETLEIEPGWSVAGFVATPCDDAYAIFEISGDAMHQVVCEATATDVELGSPSAALLFAGVPAMLYRTAPRAARLHIESPLAAYIWTWLQGA